jgi:hypothetical protein
MTEPDAHKALFARWITMWHTKVGGTQAAPAVSYALEDRALTQPVSATFAQVEITNLDSDQATMAKEGNRRFLRMGFFDVRLYGPRGQGRGALDVLAGYVKELYEATRIGAPDEHPITTYATSVRVQRDSKEYPDLRCVLVRTPFDYYERR